ncbi:oligosaccharide repeat unit polymerase [Vibrio breoganii]|uniref:oligosaccharide repeat unit polymerase n=1 Tax=Vibrio breoganii TaxID=553239 RepID=UPI000C83AF69|nr:oligosaccharide repeat unit polymerase [Vibrio breoganii]PML40664.1 hypothetical protein BCT77_00440 [Vibrio breoganii]PMO71034.1 hypothetical protein BCT02_02080 [Vibrio breoganii]PMO90476.1 hypothetical protein BCS99_04690 [Vibrio breoganii]
MQINKFVFRALFLTYLLLNVILGCYYYISGYVGGDLKVGSKTGLILEQPQLLIYSIVLVCFTLILLTLWSYFCERIKVVKYELDLDEKFVSLIFTLLILVFYIIGYFYPARLVNQGIISYHPLALFFLMFFQVKYLFLFYLVYFIDSKTTIYKVNFILYLVWAISSGYTFYLLFIFVIYLLRNLKEINLYFAFKLACIAVVILPVLRLLKYYFLGLASVESGQDFDFLSLMTDRYDGYIDLYLSMLITTMERFQHVANVYFSWVNESVLSSRIENGTIGMFYIDGWYQYAILSKLVSLNFEMHIQEALANMIFPYSYWRSQIGIAGWGAISLWHYFSAIVYGFFAIFLMYMPMKILNRPNFNIFNYIATIFLVFHAWFNDVSTYIQAMYIFVAILFVCSLVKRVLR